jgi:NAD(P)-dependent dehydrogenase (short-subunit alcohol dehydrogenase family)
MDAGAHCAATCGIDRIIMPEPKIAVVTGSSSGIGLLTSIEFAANGYTVVATMRDLSRSGRLEEAAQKAGVSDRLHLRPLDVTQFDTLAGAVDGIIRDQGRIDVLVNNAGMSVAGFIEDLSVDEIRNQFETNFFGAVAMSKAVLPTMRRQRSGHIIQVSSVGGLVAYPILGAYNASKWALEAISEALRIELHSLGIRVALIEPGSYDTDIWTRGVIVAKGGLDDNSPNKERSRRFTEFVKSRAAGRQDPRDVARLILRVAKNPNPKLRYLIGKDTAVQIWTRRLIPWRIYERLIAKGTKID